MLSRQQSKQILLEYAPYLVFVAGFSWTSAAHNGTASLVELMFINTAIVSLMLLSKWQGLTKSCHKSASAWFLLAFVGIPLGFTQLSLILEISPALLHHKTAFFLWLATIELLIRLIQYFAHSQFKKLKSKVLTMDYIAAGIMLFFSLLWASLFNSIDDPLNNQPIHIFFDISRNILRFDEFLSYFFQMLAIYTCGFTLYWINHHILIDKVLARFGVFHYIWVAVVFTLVATPVLSQLALLLPINSNEFTLLPSGNQDPFDAWNLRIAIVIMVLSTPLVLSFKWQQQVAEFAQLKQQSAQAELKLLQQQINPHFLFNTLNNLYSLTLAKSELAPDSILKLSNLLRFVVYKGGLESVSVSEEVEYLNNYIALQQIRVNNRSQVELTLSPELEENHQTFVAPLLFIVLLENAFKHGVDATDQSSWLKAEMKFSDNKLLFSCSNSIDARQSNKQQVGGVGLENLQRRLELIYPQRHQLTINQSRDKFSVELTLEVENRKADNND